MPFNSGILMILGVRVTRAGSCLGNEVSVLAGSGCLGTAQILNFHEMGGGAVGKRQCLDMSVTIRLLSQDDRGQGEGSVGPHLGSSVRRPGWKVETRPVAPWGCCWSTRLRSVSPAMSSPERFPSAP